MFAHVESGAVKRDKRQEAVQGCSGAGTREDGVPPLFSDRGTRPPLPHFFGLKFVQKL